MKILTTRGTRAAAFGLGVALALGLAGCGAGGVADGSSAGAGGSGAGGSGVGGSGGGGTGSAMLSWDAPTTNQDGTPLTDLAGYKIFYGTTSGSYANSVDVDNANPTEYTVGSLPSARVYFTVVAYDTSGNESEFSAEVFKDIP